jgi:hypothetical protein
MQLSPKRSQTETHKAKKRTLAIVLIDTALTKKIANGKDSFIATQIMQMTEPDNSEYPELGVEAGASASTIDKANTSIEEDPFAGREGKTLTWTNINMSLVVTGRRKEGETTRSLLENVWGEVPAKQTTAIMGPR